MEKIIKQLDKLVGNGEVLNYVLIYNHKNAEVFTESNMDIEFALYAARLAEKLADMRVGDLEEVE